MVGMLLRPVYQQDRGIYASDLINPIDHQSTKNDRLKPVLTTGPVNTHIDRLFANLELFHLILMEYMILCHYLQRCLYIFLFSSSFTFFLMPASARGTKLLMKDNCQKPVLGWCKDWQYQLAPDI